MRLHEVYETFCRFCLERFERPALRDAAAAVEDHERTCWKRNQVGGTITCK